MDTLTKRERNGAEWHESGKQKHSINGGTNKNHNGKNRLSESKHRNHCFKL